MDATLQIPSLGRQEIPVRPFRRPGLSGFVAANELKVMLCNRNGFFPFLSVDKVSERKASE